MRFRFASIVFACFAIATTTSAHDHQVLTEARAAASLAPLWVGPAFSGSWYTTTRSGEGFTLQVLDSGGAEVIWFTYPPAGSPTKQAWILAADGKIDGNRIRFENAFTTRGPKFGPAFDPSAVEILPWGTIEFEFTSCGEGTFIYSGPAAWGSGARPISRLTSVSELECSGKRNLHPSGARTLAGLRSRSGSWYDPAHNGEGWQIEELPDGRVQLYWFTYDETGAQAWTLGTAGTGGDRVEFDLLQPVGTHFGADFNPADVRIVPWGRLTLPFEGCGSAQAIYDSMVPGYGSGTLRPVKFTRLAGTSCVASAPATPTGGAWTQGATMPNPQSEHPVVTVNGAHCAIGGFGDPHGFKCYDLASNTWSRRANVPVARDHAEAVCANGEVLFDGGFVSDLTDPQNIQAWRYVVADDRWEPVPEIPHASASGAAVLGAFAYFGTESGAVHQVNLRTLAVRTIPTDNRAARDHSQLVAFQGEIWFMGGRNGQGSVNGRVSIFDPASETWRLGPSMVTGRSGFAAAASDEVLLVAGGERLDNPNRVIAEADAIVAGDAQWRALPPLPFPVHGVGGAVQRNAFITLGGSRAAAGSVNEGQVQIYRW